MAAPSLTTATVPSAPRTRPLQAKHVLFVVFGLLTLLVLYTRDLALLDPASPLRQRFAPIPWLMLTHGVFGALALTLGIFQFSSRLRSRYLAVHRWMGRIYVFACIIGGAAGFLLALGTDAGSIAQWGFGLLAVIWVSCAIQAWRLALARRFVEHREWMVRSFALTFAAVTLRLYLPIAGIAHLDFMES